MSRITGDMSLRQISELPGYEEIGFTLMEARPSTQEKMYGFPISGMGQMWGEDGWERMRMGFERLDEVVCSGRAYAFDYWDEDARQADPAKVRTKLVHFPGRDGAPFVMVVPGGGYNSVCAAVEGFFVAAALNELGYHAFVLTYRTREAARMPAPIEDLAQALRFVLDHAQGFSCGSEYACMGFSAGAHLAGMMGTVSWGWRRFGLPAPKAMVLCYPVADLSACVDDSNKTATDMLDTLVGDDRSEGTLAAWSVVGNIDESFPPTYTWQCADDDQIPVENLLRLCRDLTEHGVLHYSAVYPLGGHGLAKAHDEHAAHWFDGVRFFLNEVFPL